MFSSQQNNRNPSVCSLNETAEAIQNLMRELIRQEKFGERNDRSDAYAALVKRIREIS